MLCEVRCTARGPRKNFDRTLNLPRSPLECPFLRRAQPRGAGNLVGMSVDRIGPADGTRRTRRANKRHGVRNQTETVFRRHVGRSPAIRWILIFRLAGRHVRLLGPVTIVRGPPQLQWAVPVQSDKQTLPKCLPAAWWRNASEIWSSGNVRSITGLMQFASIARIMST